MSKKSNNANAMAGSQTVAELQAFREGFINEGRCFGPGPHARGPIKLMPFGEVGEFPFCEVCWEREIRRRKAYNTGVPLNRQLSLPQWGNAELVGELTLPH